MEITNSVGEIVRYELKSNEKTSSKHFYAKILRSEVYTIRIANIAETPVMITLNIERGIITMKRPYIYYGIVVFIIGILLGMMLTMIQVSESMLFTRKNKSQSM